MNRDNSVHVAEIDRHASNRRIYVALKRSSNPEWNDGHAIRRTQMPDDLLHLLGILWVNDGVGWLIGNPCEGVAVLLTHRLRRDNAIAEGRG